MIDYATAADRLQHTEARQNCKTLAEANAYIDARRISVYRHGFTPTPAHSTDVAATWARACPEWIADNDTPMFLRRQAA